jgi:pyruvate formate lyase activating enzyme
MAEWIVTHLGADVPLHFTAFHPDFKMMDVPHTPPSTLTRARDIAISHGLQYVYTGNVHDTTGSSTYCPNCKTLVMERDWYRLGRWRVDGAGRCVECGHQIPGRFDGPPGAWGPRRQPVLLAADAAVNFRRRAELRAEKEEQRRRPA